MKLKLFTLILLAATIFGFMSCDKEPVTPANDPSAEFAFENITQTSFDIIAETNLATRYAYYITTDLEEAAPAVPLLFADDNFVGTLSNGKNTISIIGLDGSTKYQVYIAVEYMVGDKKSFSDIFKLDVVETKAYEGLFTLIPSTDKFAIKFFINVPEGDTIAYNVMDSEVYDTYILNFGRIPASFLEGHEKVINILTEPTTIEFDGWADFDDPSSKLGLLPGQSLQVIVGEVKYNGKDTYGRNTYTPLYDFDGYYAAGANPEDYWLTEQHAEVRTNTAPPTINEELGIKAEVLGGTTKSLSIKLTPDAGIETYLYSYLPEEVIEGMKINYGEEGALTLMMKFSSMATGAMTLNAENLEEGKIFKLYLIGLLNNDGSEISLDIYDLETKEATDDAPKVIVTGIEDPTGENSPWKVWFNIKCPSRNAAYLKYICNYTREWDAILSTGLTYNDMMDQYGVLVEDYDVIDAINSPQGYTLSFDSWDNTESLLCVQLINEELTSSNVNNPAEGDVPVATSSSPELPDAPRVESTLFEELKGEWTATSYRYIYDEANTKYVIEQTPIVTNVLITDEPSYPATLSQEVYDTYQGFGIDKAGTDALFEEFKTSSEKFASKTRGQNRLVCLGLDLANEGNVNTDYMSPFDLFSSESYGASVTDDIFFDFGIKWFLQINEGNKVTVPIDPTRIAPMSNWGWYRIHTFAVGINEDNTAVYDPSITEFDVTISEDKNTITIEPKVTSQGTFYHTIGYDNMGYLQPDAMSHSLVLTRGVSEPSGSNKSNMKHIMTSKSPYTSYKMIGFNK